MTQAQTSLRPLCGVGSGRRPCCGTRESMRSSVRGGAAIRGGRSPLDVSRGVNESAAAILCAALVCSTNSCGPNLSQIVTAKSVPSPPGPEFGAFGGTPRDAHLEQHRTRTIFSRGHKSTIENVSRSLVPRSLSLATTLSIWDYGRRGRRTIFSGCRGWWRSANSCRGQWWAVTSRRR